MQGQGLRDSAQQFVELDITVLGASFDTSADNLAFAAAQGFEYRLLSDTDRAVGTRYEAVRSPDDRYANFPRRVSYLIDPDGVVRIAYDVTDVAGHAATVVADAVALRGDAGNAGQ